ncbi:restriction endonuclease subunit S [Helicobacter pylori]|uniref:restriction endonuclease subunit S n=1 Tax=Helicobacter pylori TaxID=210 RepID=UPI00032A2A5B|nr:restriction endonuclease subunit S [Helicobacter pylori]AGL70674.1 restriction endonuclease [Helicobacter pylori UM066]EQK96849.1 type II restriction endonuclease [Helicobacter pylori UM066]
MIGPLSSQLNAIKWGEFKLGDLFEAGNGDFDIQKRHINHKGEFVITAGLSNNGVLGQSDIKAKVFESHTITIDMFGCAFYRSFPYKMVTHARVFSLKPKFEINHKIGLFLSTLFFGYPKKFGYENMCSWAKIKNDKVILPLKPTANAQTLEDIDFDFMEKFIAELEAYLKAAGLENTTLSSDEENALNVFNNSIGGNTPCGLRWQSSKLGDLFEIRPTKAYKLTNSHLFGSNAKNPVVTNSSLNNGISGYSSLEPTEKGNQITYSDTTTSEGIFYQKRPFIGYSHVQGLYPLKYHEFWNEKTLLYIVTAFKKVACGRFNYGNKFNRKIASEMLILLPTNQHGKIDFHFMRTLINALMKQTIQGVAEYCDAKIQAAKEIISQETPTPKDSLF